MLKLVELEEYAKTYPHKLSGGQMQRAALVRSLATKPDLLFLMSLYRHLMLKFVSI